MNNLQLEIEEALEHYEELYSISLGETLGDNDDEWASGYATGQLSAYEDIIGRYKELIELVAGIHTGT